MYRPEVSSGSRSSTPTMGTSSDLLMMNHSLPVGVEGHPHGTPAAVQLNNRMSLLSTHHHHHHDEIL